MVFYLLVYRQLLAVFDFWNQVAFNCTLTCDIPSILNLCRECIINNIFDVAGKDHFTVVPE